MFFSFRIIETKHKKDILKENKSNGGVKMTNPKQKSFYDLFEENVEYPQNIAETGVPNNTLFEFVSNTYLNGIVNYTNVFYAVMVDRYEKTSSERKQEIYEALQDMVHTNYSYADDDVVLLAETENCFWIFYYDGDVSDCEIGRVDKSLVSKEEFKQLYLASLHETYFELPLPRGWVRG